MVRFKPTRRSPGAAESAKARKLRQGRGGAREPGPHHPRLSSPLAREARSQSEPSASGPELPSTASGGEDEFRSGQKVRMALVAVAVVILLWFLSSDEELGGWRVPALQAWALDIAAATPLLALIRFRDPRAREETVTLEFELKFLSGLYGIFAIVDIFSGTGTQWAALPALVFGIAVYAGIWYTNRQARARG